MEQFKTCKTCLVTKTLDNFVKDRTSKMGRLGHCKECTSNKKEKEALEEGYKRCSRCKEIKRVDDFVKDAQKSDGLRSNCIMCTRKEYYKRRQEEYKEARIRPEKEDGKMNLTF